MVWYRPDRRLDQQHHSSAHEHGVQVGLHPLRDQGCLPCPMNIEIVSENAMLLDIFIPAKRGTFTKKGKLCPNKLQSVFPAFTLLTAASRYLAFHLVLSSRGAESISVLNYTSRNMQVAAIVNSSEYQLAVRRNAVLDPGRQLSVTRGRYMQCDYVEKNSRQTLVCIPLCPLALLPRMPLTEWSFP